MDPRTPGDVEATGTLPVIGGDADAVEITGTLPILPDGPLRVAPAPASRQPAATTPPTWLEEARAGLSAPGIYLAYQDAGRRVVIPVTREWTRIGRSMAAEVRFDDATVSRRHALIVCQAGGVRVLDDRSLNGVYVNGRRVEWAPLNDGDEVTVGRHTLHLLEHTGAAGPPDPEPAALTE